MPEKVAIAPASSVATSLDDGVERDGLLGEDERAAGDGRDQRDDVAVGELVVGRRVLLVDRVEQALGLVAEVELAHTSATRVGVDLACRPARLLAQPGEEPHRHAHAK